MTSVYELTLVEEFSAAHRLTSAMHKCARLHGHNWKVEVRVRAEELDANGMVIDFHDLRGLVRRVLEELDHTYLNDHPAFRTAPPTAENVARYLCAGLAVLLPSSRVRMSGVRVWESASAAAAYTPGESPCPSPAGGKG